MKGITIKANNRTISAWVYYPACDSFPAVIISHGFNGSGEHFSRYAEQLTKANIGVITFDFCGGSITSKSSLATTEMTIFTQVEDLKAVIDFAKSEHCINGIYCHGESMGGLVTALTAEDYGEDIKGISLLYPAFCIPDNWNTHFPDTSLIPETFSLWGVNLGKIFFTSIHDCDVFEMIGTYNKKVLITHGDKDNIVPISYSEKASSIYENCRFVLFPGEGHGFSPSATGTLIDMLIEFIN